MSPTPRARVAFLGLGIMGTGMARRLLGAGFPLTVFNRTPGAAAALAAEGALVAASPRDAAARADIVISMVTDDAASRALWLGEDGALADAATPGDARDGAVLIDCSTVTVGWSRELDAAATRAGCAFLDAPVTGSRLQAAAGELNFLVGGPTAALERARPALEAMGRSIVHLGPAGSGASMKLVNNFLGGVQAASLAEAMAMIERSSLDRDLAVEVLTGGAPGSPIVKTLAARMTAPDFTPNFFLRLMAKDLGYAASEGRALGVAMTTAAAALEVFQHAIDRGDGDRDMSAVVEQFRSPGPP